MRKSIGLLLCLLLYITSNAQDFELIPYRVGNKWGFSDKGGEMKIQPKYSDVIPFNKGFAAYKRNGKWGVIDTKGKEITQPLFDSVSKNFFNAELIKDGTTLLGLEVYMKNKKLLVDNAGKIVKSDWSEKWSGSEYAIAMANSPNVEIVEKDGRFGFKNVDAETEYPAEYDSIVYDENSPYYAKDDFIFAKKYGKWGVVSIENKTILGFEYDSIQSQQRNRNEIKVSKGGKWGVVNIENKTIVPILYNNVEFVPSVYSWSSYSFYIVSKGDLWGIISLKELKEPELLYKSIKVAQSDDYDDLRGAYLECENGKVDFYNPMKSGAIFKNTPHDEVEFCGKIITFREGTLYGFVELIGLTDVEAKYKKIIAPKKDVKYFEVVTANNTKGYVNVSGKEYFED